MRIENEELKEIIDLWDLKKDVKKKIFKILDENQCLSPTHLFRYYVPSGKKDKVGELEREFSKKFGVRYSLAVNSGTSALISALIACSIGPVMKLLYRVILFLLHVQQFLLQRQYL